MQFKQIAEVARARWGLHLTDAKATLVQNRLTKHVIRSPFDSVNDYVEHLNGSPTEEDLLLFFDILSTNTTSFYREMHHFTHLERVVFPRLAATKQRKLRVWSAACSTGAEPYTLAIHLLEQMPDAAQWDFRILATDLSKSSIDAAKAAEYPGKMLEEQSKQLVQRYFTRTGRGEDAIYKVGEKARSMVSVHELNLMGDWPMKGPFDIIFLRNVMIYFDLEIRTRLVTRMREMLTPDGLLFIGSAETLSGMNVGLRAVIPSVYAKEGA